MDEERKFFVGQEVWLCSTSADFCLPEICPQQDLLEGLIIPPPVKGTVTQILGPHPNPHPAFKNSHLVEIEVKGKRYVSLDFTRGDCSTGHIDSGELQYVIGYICQDSDESIEDNVYNQDAYICLSLEDALKWQEEKILLHEIGEDIDFSQLLSNREKYGNNCPLEKEERLIRLRMACDALIGKSLPNFIVDYYKNVSLMEQAEEYLEHLRATGQSPFLRFF